MKQNGQLYDQLMECYTKQDLLEMGKIKQIPVKASQRKGEIAARLAEEMLRPEVMSRYLRWLKPGERSCFLALAGVEELWEETEESDELFPWRLLYSGYVFFDENGGDLLQPEDVRKLVRKVWTSELQASYRQYAWILCCMELGTQLYGVMPYPILARLIRQKVQYGVAVSALPQLLEDIPAELNPYGFGEKGIYVAEIEPLLFKLEFPEDSEDYYIPSVMEIENQIFYTEEFQNLMNAKLHAWKQKFQQPFLDIEQTLWMLCSMKSLECATCHMADLIALEGDPALYDEESQELTALGTQLCRMLQKLDRYFRRVRYHGFTKEEWDERRSKQPISWGRQLSVVEPPKPQSAKIISLDEQREKRKKK